MSELAGAAGGYERNRGVTCDWMGKDAGVHDRSVRGEVGTAGYDDAEAVVEGDQLFKPCKVRHAHLKGGSG
jgi:hypothetical protein